MNKVKETGVTIKIINKQRRGNISDYQDNKYTK